MAADLPHRGAQSRQLLRCLRRADPEMFAGFAIRVWLPRNAGARLDAISIVEDYAVRAKDFGGLRGCPKIESSFRGLRPARGDGAVGVQRRAETAAGKLQLAQREVEDASRNGGVETIVRNLIGLAIDNSELRLIVEHLLEMRNAPLRVDGIAMEAPSNLIVDATPRHPLQRSGRHIESPGLPGAGVRAQQELDRDGPGTTGAPPKPPFWES